MPTTAIHRFANRFAAVAFCAVTWILLVSGCGSSAKAPSPQDKPQASSNSAKTRVFVVSYPLAYFTDRIGGDAVEVTFPVPKSDDPARWDPDGDVIATFQTADLVLLNGADYAKWTLRASLPWSKTVVTTREVEKQYITVPNAVTHSHGPEGEHSHAGIASETWLNLELALSQAKVIQEELIKLTPDSGQAINANFAKLEDDLLQLDRDLKAVITKSSVPFTGSHPAFRYLAQRYATEIPTVNWEASEFPSNEQWKAFEKLLGQVEPAPRKASCMLWTAAPTAKTQKRLDELGVRVVVFQTLGRHPAKGDYLTSMRANLERLQEAIAGP